MEPLSDGPTSPLEPVIHSLADQLISVLCTRELLEVQDNHRKALASELARSASEADTFTKLSAKLTACLVNSEHVEEIYGTDQELEEIFDQVLSKHNE